MKENPSPLSLQGKRDIKIMEVAVKADE